MLNRNAANAHRVVRMIDRYRKAYRFRFWSRVQFNDLFVELITFVEDVENWQRIEARRRGIRP